MNHWQIKLVAALVVVMLICSDFFYFKQKRDQLNGGSISESFVRKGVLGKILKNNGYLSLTEGTAEVAASQMCADDEDLKGFNYHDTVRLRFFIIVDQAGEFEANIVKQDNAGEFTEVIHSEVIKVNPREYYYSFSFRAPISSPFSLRLKSTAERGVNIGHIFLDGQFNRTHNIVYRSKVVDGVLSKHTDSDLFDHASDKRKWETKIIVGKLVPQLDITLQQGLPKALFNGVFPGKKHQGYCQYTANVQHRNDRSSQQKGNIPLVKLYVDHKRWYGQHGILNNRVRAHGRAWEVPAKVKIYNQDKYIEQSVGLRFHGGIPARSARKYAQNYRIYARNDYGNNTLNSEILNGHDRGLDFKTVVIKNTYHANFFETFTEFNPFTHALAFDVANEINAIVPDHFMLDLYVNDEQQPLFLGIEHLSERTIAHWLGHDSFELFIYRNENSAKQKKIFKHVIQTVRNATGENALEELERFYDVDNVINSIILNAYVANHDFCQGAELFINADDDVDSVKVTSINWDLDHAFMQIRDGKWSIKGDHIFFPMLNKRYKDNNDRDCERTLVYAWVYEQSQAFRDLFSQRLNDLLANELSYSHMNKVLDKYRHINEQYYQGKHNQAINDLENYTIQRPKDLVNDLQKLLSLQEQNASH